MQGTFKGSVFTGRIIYNGETYTIEVTLLNL